MTRSRLRRIITVAPKHKRYIMGGRFGFFQTEKNGQSVLAHQMSWTKTAGFYINTRWGCAWFRFRRFGPDWR